MFQKNKVSEAPACCRFPPEDKGHGGCTSTFLKCENHSQGKKATLSHLSRQLPNTEGTRPLPAAPGPRKTALPKNHKHITEIHMNG